MKWFTYMRRTSWAQICADIKEYQNLWRQYFVLRANKSAEYNEMVDVVSGEEDNRKVVPACVRQVYYFTPSISNHTSDSNNSLMFVRNAVCCKFDKTGDSVKCAKLDCPCVQRNHNYVDACTRLEITRRARRDFWRAKFANIK